MLYRVSSPASITRSCALAKSPYFVGKDCSKLWSMQPSNGQPTTDQTTEQTRARRVTVPDAAVLLGLSEDAVRSRLKRGTLRKEKGNDGTVFVVLSPESPTDRPTSNCDRPATSQTSVPTDLVKVLRNQVEYLRAQLAEEREANRENRRIIGGLVQRVPELEAATELPEAPETATEEPGKSDVPPEHQKRRSWLYWFFFGS
jgi:hypothetical protein